MPYSKQYIRLVTYQKSEKSMVWLPRRARKRIFFTPFSPFSAQKIFSCKTAYAIFKVVYQASHIPKIRKNYGLVAEMCSKRHIFHTFFAIFGPKKIFLQNCLCHIQSSISGQSHTKNQKNLWSGCQEMLKNAYFSHLFCHFWPKIICFRKSGFVVLQIP